MLLVSVKAKRVWALRLRMYISYFMRGLQFIYRTLLEEGPHTASFRSC